MSDNRRGFDSHCRFQ